MGKAGVGVGGMGVALGWMVGGMAGTAVSAAVAKGGGGINVAVGSASSICLEQAENKSNSARRINVNKDFFMRVL